MKKIFFTAMAIFAFSAVSVANTNSIKSSVKVAFPKSNSTIQKKKVVVKDCAAFAYHVCAFMEELEGCFTSEQYNGLYNQMLNYCNSRN
jgi:hypothetical protein